MKKFALAVLIGLMVIGVNFHGGLMERLGVDTNILMFALLAMVVVGIMQFQHVGLGALVVVLALAANVPEETALSIGYNPDYVLAALVGLVALPFVARQLG